MSSNPVTNNAWKARKLQCWMKIWVPKTRPNEVPKHNKIFVKHRNRENHMEKTLLQTKMKRLFQKIGTKRWSWRTSLKHKNVAKLCQKVTVDLKNLHWNRTWPGREDYNLHEHFLKTLLWIRRHTKANN